jgi:hypothetical protein
MEYGFLKDPPRFMDSDVCPGSVFLGLKPYLSGVAVAGYWADHQSPSFETDRNYVYPYLTARFCLSPTMLDFKDPFAHEYVVMVNANNTVGQKLLNSLHAHNVAGLKDLNSGMEITLVQRTSRP